MAIGLKPTTASTPRISATATGAASIRSAERPLARITTSSELRARPMNSSIAAIATRSGKIV